MFDESSIDDEQVKKYASFDMLTNSAVYALAQEDQDGYQKAVYEILNNVLSSEQNIVSYICYLIAIYGQTLKMFANTTYGNLTDTLTDASLFDVLVTEDPSYFYKTVRDLKDPNES